MTSSVKTGIPQVDALGDYIAQITGQGSPVAGQGSPVAAPGAVGAPGASNPNAPRAIPQLVTGPDGLPHVQYVDAQTGQIVTNLAGYNIVSAGGNSFAQTPATAPVPIANPTGGNVQNPNGGNGSQGGGALNSTPATPGHLNSQNPQNNYGYEHKPGIVSLAGKLPGGIGLAAKAVNAGWNMNNMAATNTARAMLGLAPTGVGGTLKGIAKDNQGQVSNNATINGKQYSVGFEAMSPTGVTNLTPMEANERANLLGGITETPGAKPKTPPETTAPQSRISQITGIPGGFASKALGALGLTKGFAARALDNIFGVNQPAPAAVANPAAVPGAPPAATSVANLSQETAPAAIGNPDSAPAAKSVVDHPDPSTGQVTDRTASNNFGYQGSTATGNADQSTPSTNTGKYSGTSYAADNMAGTAQTGAPAGTTGPASPAGAATNLGNSPAARAAMGLSAPRSPEERAMMEKAIAGELDPHTMKALAAADQTTPAAIAAQKEFGSIVATMENRAVSPNYLGIADVVDPSQYNSMKPANMAVTNPAFTKNQAVLDAQLSNFYAGKIAVPNYDVTSYYNPTIANPAWGVNGPKPSQRMTQAEQVGYHLFGVLPEYGPDAYAQQAAKAQQTMSGTSYQPGKMADDTPNAWSGGGTGTVAYNGDPGQSGGGGYNPGGMNSPSGSSSDGGGGTGAFGGSNASASGGNGGGGYNPGGGSGGGYSPGGLGSPSGSSGSYGGSGAFGGSSATGGAYGGNAFGGSSASASGLGGGAFSGSQAGIGGGWGGGGIGGATGGGATGGGYADASGGQAFGGSQASASGNSVGASSRSDGWN